MKIADVSHHQESIDWEKAGKELDMVVIRSSIGAKIDSRYLENAQKCKIPYGVYHYVKAATAAEAKREANVFLQFADRGKPLFYVADIENSTQGESNTEEVCVAFLEELLKKNKKVGLYIGDERYAWAGDAIGMCHFIWIPRYGKDDGEVPPPKYRPENKCDMWQYTTKGIISGIDGTVDLNILTGDKGLEWFTGAKKEEKMLTNLELAAFCKEAHRSEWAYWYGTCGYKCTNELLNVKGNQYPAQYTESRKGGYLADVKAERMCADCVGMIKGFFWTGGIMYGKNVYQSNNCPDVSADGMIGLCAERGDIKTIPDIPGILVHKKGHIGVYVGDGYVVEMRGYAYDCVMAKVEDSKWTEWGKLPGSMLEYSDAKESSTSELGARVLSKGSTGDDVKEMQEALILLGYNLGSYGADGDFGSKTQAAVKKFQSDNGLEETGKFDTASYKMLLAIRSGEKESAQDTPDGGGEPAYVLILEGNKETLKKIQGTYGGKLALLDEVEVAG